MICQLQQKGILQCKQNPKKQITDIEKPKDNLTHLANFGPWTLGRNLYTETGCVNGTVLSYIN